ncbi:hypothetical protein DL93DRAFT_2169231 [Clavulina sp. PMI_390]|nr:hypothetical protein DL93DRAFT_2169231 [Clavulina sp. PMI_390]
MAKSLNSKTLAKLDLALGRMRTIGAGPMPADPFDHAAWEMACAHAMILIELQNIYVKARTIAQNDKRDFVLYALFWVDVVEHHHEIEEGWVMELLKGPSFKDEITHEHDGFREQIHDIQHYLTSCLPAGTKWGFRNHTVSAKALETFRAETLEDLIEKLVEVFLEHFCDEPTYLEAQKMRAYHSHEQMEAVIKRVVTYIQSQPPSFHVNTWLHRPNSTFPPVPWFVKVLINWVWYWPDRNIWRFAPTLTY